jgi:ATPase subunit of ABC transporter with duplicated ATPase domains
MHAQSLSFKHHKNAPYFFKELSFKLERGKMHALHGKNGMGKTVLLSMLAGHAPQEAIVEGHIEGSAALVNQRFDQMIADQFTFQENLQFACMGRFPLPHKRLKPPKLVPAFLERFHIDASKPARLLSGGQRQILSLMMILQRGLDVLLLDEPTAALDEQNAELVFQFLKTLQDITLLVVCHDRDLIDRYADGSHFHIEMDQHSGTRRLS